MVRQKVLPIILSLALVLGVLASGCTGGEKTEVKPTVEEKAPAQEEKAPAKEEEKAPPAEEKAVPALKGIAYVAGEGGHYAVVDLYKAMTDPNYMPGKVDITKGAGSEISGSIAGLNVESTIKQKLKDLGLDVKVVNPEEVYNEKCSGCHGDYPGANMLDDVKGKDNFAWKEGIEKMVSEKGVQLDEEEIDTLARDLAVKNGGSVKQGGSHGVALSPDKTMMVAGTLGGQARIYEGSGTKWKAVTDLIDVGEKFCDAIWGPDGFVYFEDMANGKVYKFDPNAKKVADEITFQTKDGSKKAISICGIQFLDDKAEKALISDMPTGQIFLVDMKTGEILKSATVATFIHQIQLTPDKSELWITAPDEFNVAEGLAPWSLGGKDDTGIEIIDPQTLEKKGHIAFEGRFPHDVEFTPDGKYALVAARTYVPQGTDYLTIVDTKTHEVIDEIDTCGSCHSKIGILIKANEGIPNLCGVDVDWTGYESVDLEKKGYKQE